MKIASPHTSWFLGMILILPVVSFALRDPTQPASLTAASKNDGALVVKMIKSSKDNSESIAYVNDKMVKVGDKVNDAEVVAIESNAVLFRTNDNKLLSVSINHYVIKKNIDKSHEDKK
jgi:hypothetical protein